MGVDLLEIFQKIFLKYNFYIIADMNTENGTLSSTVTTLSDHVNTETSFHNNLECRDNRGRVVQHGMHFIPPGVDMCILCICHNGHSTVNIQEFSTKFS